MDGRCELDAASRTLNTEPRWLRRPEGERWLWIFDFDGTLSPLVSDRREAVMDPSCRRLLSDLLRAEQQVAVLSSRTLDDLGPRVGVPGVYTGGSMGLDWLLPTGERRSYAVSFAADVARKREAALAQLERLRDVFGVDAEDKHWTVSLHVRHLSEAQKEGVKKELETFAGLHEVRVRKAPEAFEVLFSPLLDKSFGVSMLCKIVNWNGEQGRIVYAGDDENDLVAMKLVAHLGGVTFSVAGLAAAGESIRVSDPEDLASVCRRIAGLT